MKSVVCIKQVPDIEHLKFDQATRRLIREGVPSEINPFDRRAITAAVEARNKFGGEVIVITMGPPQARDALLEALAMGCDRALHLNDRAFAGADTLATARTLAAAIRPFQADVVWCGKYAIDAETAQVPPMLAELLDLPQVMGVTRIEYAPDMRGATVTRETDDGFETLSVAFPVLFSTAERLCKPIKVRPEDLGPAQAKPLQVVHPADLGLKPQEIGASGSPTWVEGLNPVEPKRKRIIRTLSDDLEGVAAQVLADLRAEGLVLEPTLNGEPRMASPQPRPASAPARRAGGRAIWVVAETLEGAIRPVTLELLGGALELAAVQGDEVSAILIGSDVRRWGQTLASYGATRVYVAESPALARYNTETYAAVLHAAIERLHPWAVLLPSTANGRDLAPRVAARLGVGLTGDVIGLELDQDGHLVMLKPAYGGHIVAPIQSRTLPAMATMRAGMLCAVAADPAAGPQWIDLEVPPVIPRARVEAYELKAAAGPELDAAENVICIGMGVGGPENLPVVEDLARLWGAALGATRRVVDAGWMPRQMQIGLTGHSISPHLYVALGVRGTYNHTVGVQRAQVILAINTEPSAPIFQACDYGIVGDWREAVTALIRQSAPVR